MNPAPDLMPSKMSKLAVLALIVSFIPIIGLFGLFIGVLALIQIGRSGGELRGIWLAIGGMLISVMVTGITILMGAAALPAFVKARDAARMKAAEQQLQSLSDACQRFAQDEGNEKFPADPRTLYPKYIAEPSKFKNHRFTEEVFGCKYIPGFSTAQPTAVIAYEVYPAGKPPKVVHLLFADGTIEKLPPAALKDQLTLTQKLGKELKIEYKEIPLGPGSFGSQTPAQ
jgi:type II secretory pathway pseudopilin PulG